LNTKQDLSVPNTSISINGTAFFVESGKMIVRVWQSDDQEGLVDETILGPGDFTQVKPGKVHQFEGLEDGVAFELYWAEFNHDDIVRRTIGTQVTKGGK